MTLPRDNDGLLSAWAWPGGFEIFYLDSQGSILCYRCARDSDSDPEEIQGFRPVDYGINWESELYCDDCSTQIEAAYQV